MLGGIIGGAVGAVGKAVGMGLQAHQNKKNQEREDNIRKQTWAREDNAVQRRAEDMKKAGINPLLAAGDPAQASTGGAVTGGQAPDAEGLGGALQQAGQWIDQMGIAKKQQILQEQKQDAEIEKIQAETEGQRIENSQGDARGENLEADTAQKREATRKMEQEREVMKAQIDAIRANTALTEQQKKTEEKRTMQESLLKIAQAHLKLGIGGTGVGAEVDINIDIERYYKMLQDGATMEEITDEVLKEVEKQAKEAKPEKKEKDWERNLREADEEFKRNNPNYRDIKIY